MSTPRPDDHAIELRSGRYLDLAAPDPASITFDDIAKGLSQTCRYAGQTKRFYSVAEHACLVERRLYENGASVATRLGGLHHDDTEAFIHDVARPLKSLLPDYQRVEDRLAAAIAEALSLPALDALSLGLIKAADDWALSAEAYHLMESRGEGWWCWGIYQPSIDGGIALGHAPPLAKNDFRLRHERLVRATRGDAG